MDETIKIFETYGVINLASRRRIEELLSKLKLPNSNNITVDVSGCMTDYSCTSLLFDVVLEHLEKFQGEKKLRIITDGLPIEYFYHDLFLGSKYFNLGDSFKLTTKEYEFLLKELKDKKNIEIEIVHSTSA